MSIDRVKAVLPDLTKLTGKKLQEHLTNITITAKKSPTEAKALFDHSLAKQIEEEREKAQPIIATIIEVCEKAALNKKSKAVIMELIPGKEEGFSDILEPSINANKDKWRDLGFKAKAVYDYIQTELRLTVTVETKNHYMPDIGYEKPPVDFKPVTYELVVSWPGEKGQMRY